MSVSLCQCQIVSDIMAGNVKKLLKLGCKEKGGSKKGGLYTGGKSREVGKGGNRRHGQKAKGRGFFHRFCPGGRYDQRGKSYEKKFPAPPLLFARVFPPFACLPWLPLCASPFLLPPFLAPNFDNFLTLPAIIARRAKLVYKPTTTLQL